LNSKLKSALQYALMLLLTAALVWLSLRSLNVGAGENKSDFIWKTWQKSDKLYLLMMAFFVLISHLIRAERWRVILLPTGNRINLRDSFLSVMVGYLINLVVPRGGEVSRCYNLYKLDKTPAEVSFGTVVVERIIDVLCLLLIIVISFVVEWSRLQAFIATLNFSSPGSFISSWIIIVAVLILAAVAGFFYFLSKNEKVKKLIVGFKEGLLAVFRMERKPLFIFYTVAIWMLYFSMSYCVIKAFPETSNLGFSAVLTLFAIGGLAMAAPLPGGAGSYHTIVPMGLVMLYSLPMAEAIAFVFIFHAWQTIIVIVAGLISLITSYAIIRWRKAQTK
jgi:glycosyltransferase 2 family protein